MTMADSLASVRTDLTILGKDVEQSSNTIDKLEITIDKLTDISNNLTKLVTVYSNRIDSHDESIRHIYSTIEKNSSRADDKFEQIKTEIVRLEKDINQDIEKTYQRLSDKLDKFSIDLKSDAEKKEVDTHSRLSLLEQFQWKLMGGGIVAGFLVSTVGQYIFKLITKS